jgi:putative peptide zinc metalloprotease protein
MTGLTISGIASKVIASILLVISVMVYSREAATTQLLPDLRNHYPPPTFDQDLGQGVWQINQQVYYFSEPETFVLQCCLGKYTIAQVERACQKKFPECPADLVTRLIERLIAMGVLTTEEENQADDQSALKPGLQLVEYRHWLFKENLWLLRNPDDRTYLCMSEDCKQVVESLATQSPQEANHTYPQFPQVWQELQASYMIKGTKPPTKKIRRGKFTPMHLMYFDKPLGNPDPWLSRCVNQLGWLWSRASGYLLLATFALSLFLAWRYSGALAVFGKNLWQAQGARLLISTTLWSLAIVTLHELGHCFTLKHYARQVPHLGLKVPEVGLMFMCLMPTVYCDTTDLLFLPKVYQRALVVAAGIIVQLMIWMIAFGLWLTTAASWLRVSSYIIMGAALLTIAWNLNPLAKFDGYYFLEIITGVINLKERSRNFYQSILSRRPSQEPQETRWILLLYAPFSIIYGLLVMAFIFSGILGWGLTQAPALMLLLTIAWLIYYFFPEPA